jgi:thymidylate synthase
MRGQDVWIGLPYDLFFYTTLHELVAGWLGAELGTYRHHVGSLHIYERDMESAAAVTSVTALPEMPELVTDWDGFDDLLSHVQAGKTTGHAAWDAMGTAMQSYRLWKQGDRNEARRTAAGITGPLNESLAAWYAKLSPTPHDAASAPSTMGPR